MAAQENGGFLAMSLINCPECGHEVSTLAVECPNCGRPAHIPVHEPMHETVIATPVRRESFPSWVFIPIGICGVLLLLVVFFALSRNEQETANSVNINISAKRAAANTERESRPVPATSDDMRTVSTAPSAPPSTTYTTTTSVPGSGGEKSDRGVVILDAKVTTSSGSQQAVKNEKFYLLDKDLESILSDADLEAINGESLTNSLGMAVMQPDKYGDFRRDALAAINRHIKYSMQTDGAGKVQIGNVEPDSYYLFGVTRTANGFAVWSSPVNISAGQNALNLSPQQLTEIGD